MWLVMETADGRKRTFPLDRPCTVIGREARCDVRIALPAVACRHCEIRFCGEVLTVVDLGSVHGTLHNGRPVEHASLDDRDQVTIGPVTFTVFLDGVATPSRSTQVEPKPAESVEIEPPTITTRRPGIKQPGVRPGDAMA